MVPFITIMNMKKVARTLEMVKTLIVLCAIGQEHFWGSPSTSVAREYSKLNFPTEIQE